MRAICLIRPAPHYRREAFVAGLEANGYRVSLDRPVKPEAGDVLVLWNRYGMNDVLAAKWEAAGCPVIVAENGYLGRDAEDRQFYALALGDHNGAGQWTTPGDDSWGQRWASLDATPAPWRAPTPQGHILICGQRGIGSARMVVANDWRDGVVRRLRTKTKRPIRFRRHPAQAGPPMPPLEEDLAGAWACVIWASTAGVRALILGVPVFYDAPAWICSGAARHGLDRIEEPMTDDARRSVALSRMAWAQWTVEEIASGEPFRRLLALAGDVLPETRQGKIAAAL